MNLENKIKNAIEIIKKYTQGKNFYLGHSGGKDSAVILDLVKKAGFSDLTLIHNVKPLYETSPNGLTDTHIDTLKYLYENVITDEKVLEVIFVEGRNADKQIEIIEKYNFELQIDGTRRYENSRDNKSSTFIWNRKEVNRSELPEYVAMGLFGLSFCYPIYDWADEEVFEYIVKNNIKISKEYDNDDLYLEAKNKFKENK